MVDHACLAPAPIERSIDFFRHRRMLCGTCSHSFTVDLEGFHKWQLDHVDCPGCGVTSEQEGHPRVHVSSDDLALDESSVPRLAWYHSSTHPDWPSKDWDPTAEWDEQTRKRMSRMAGGHSIARVAARQQAMALHVGTYEAAIHNMLRRIHNQPERGKQFYLYRVYLKPTVVVRSDWLIDPSNFVGDVFLADVLTGGSDVARYLNYHEDPGGLSLALGRDAIAGTQRIAVPLAAGDESWVEHAAAEISSTIETPLPVDAPRKDRIGWVPAKRRRGRELTETIASRLPINLRTKFRAAAELHNTDPEEWARYVVALADLIEHPERTLAALNRQEFHPTVEHQP